MTTEKEVERDFRNLFANKVMTEEVRESIITGCMTICLGLIQKSDKYDELDELVGKFYDDENGIEGDLCSIGEVVAGKLGYL